MTSLPATLHRRKEREIRNSIDRSGRLLRCALPGTAPALLIFVTLLGSGFVWTIPPGPAHASLSTLALALAAWFAGILFLPQSCTRDRGSRRLQAILVWSLTVVLIFAALALPGHERIAPGLMGRTTLSLFLMTAISSLLVSMLARGSTAARQTVFCGAAILSALPVWLGPLVEISGDSPLVTDTVIGASPITVLAVALDLDYLRATWFYGHTVIGSLRYDYLPWSGYSLALVVMIAGLVLSMRPNRRLSLLHYIRKKAGPS